MLKNKTLSIIFLILLILPAIWSLIQPGFFLSDDGEWMVIRFSSFYENLVNGQFPVRFLSRLNNGFGYSVSNFLYPLFMYIGSPIHFLGFSFVETIKIILGGSLILGGVFSFLWLRNMFGNAASFIGALVYSLFPYHLWDIYKRGSVGEVLALAIVPFILWQVKRKNLTFVSLGIGLLIVSHNTLALIFLPIIAGYMILNTNLKFMALTILLGAGLSSFFSIPAIYDLQFTVFSQTSVSNFKDYFINQTSFNLLGPIFLLFISNFFFFTKNKNYLYFVSITLVSFFLTLGISSQIWETSLSSLVQFPFRFLSVVMLGLAFLSAFQIEKLRERVRGIALIVIILLTFISAKDFLTPTKFQNYDDSFYSTNQATTTVKNEYMPKWIKEIPFSYPSKVEAIEGKSEIKNLEINPNSVEFRSIGRESVLQVNTAYFPGWKVYINGVDTRINYEENGRIRFNVPNGENKIEIKFSETNVRLISDFISIVSLILILGWLRLR